MKPATPIWILTLVLLLSFGAFGCSSGSSEGVDPDGDIPADGDDDGKIPYVVVSGDVALLLGETLTLNAKTINGTDEAYEWASEDSGVATVEDGVVTGVGLGSAVITATGSDTGKTGAWGVYVYTTGDDVVDGSQVRISGPVTVEVGQTVTLSATTLEGTDSGYTWTSSSTAVATVADGVVTGVYPGEVQITATGVDTGKSGVWGMYVYTPPVQIPTVVVSGGFSVMVGETLQLEAETLNGSDDGYTWSSSDSDIATVSEAGLVTGLASGEVIISAVGQDTQVGGTIGIVVLDEAGPEAPFFELWAGSAHANAESESFRHWDVDGSIPANCAKCHSTYGLLDYLGVDGSNAGEVNNDAALGSVVSCVACHNAGTVGKDEVVFPSGVTLAGLGKESVCMECHQGRESGISVQAALAAAELADDDTVSAALSFKNIHYAAAGAVQAGSQVHGGYQYPNKAYDRTFEHVAGAATCITCHDPHTLAIKDASCAQCHGGGDYRDIRALGSKMDYDGDGNTSVGIYYEIEGLKDVLYEAIQTYARDVVEAPIVYDASAYPYFFNDSNDNGEVDAGEATFANRYVSWTGRLLKAAYNYQFAKKDKGAFAHNAKYVIQLLTDSIADINTVLDNPVGSALASRDDAGHFRGTGTAWRRWDNTGVVPSNCARCHSSDALPFYLQYGVDTAAAPSNGMACATCHDDLTTFTVRTAAQVKFPSGVTYDSGDNTSNLCMTCHQGRESMTSLAAHIGSKPDDTVDATLSFRNIHYAPTGAVRLGKVAQGAYMYGSNYYDGVFAHAPGYTECADCHSVHTQKVKIADCATCHEGVETLADLRAIRMAGSAQDFDGDGNTSEGIKGEIDGLLSQLYAAIQTYAADHPDAASIVYSGSNPYFFIDTNGNGQVDPGEATSGNRYVTWTPRLLKAAYNYQVVKKDTGAYAHNPKFAIQVLVDSLTDLGADVSGLARNANGHFNSASRAFRNWDGGSGLVTAGCARCHSDAGFQHYLATGTNPTTAMPPSPGLSCQTCHSDVTVENGSVSAPVHYVAQVTFPGGQVVENDAQNPNDSLLCMSCHSGRTGKGDIDASITANNFRFLNVHYGPAGGVLYGTDGKVGYEYTGKTYVGKFNHVGAMAPADCTYCHQVAADGHSFKVSCVGCHGTVTPDNVRNVRHSNYSADYNGNGNNSEPLYQEVSALGAALLAKIEDYALNVRGAGIAYNGASHPYFFKADLSGAYASWDAKLMKAAHNYQIYKKDPGAWAHNTRYIIQLLIDSIEDLGGDISTYTRP